MAKITESQRRAFIACILFLVSAGVGVGIYFIPPIYNALLALAAGNLWGFIGLGLGFACIAGLLGLLGYYLYYSYSLNKSLALSNKELEAQNKELKAEDEELMEELKDLNQETAIEKRTALVTWLRENITTVPFKDIRKYFRKLFSLRKFYQKVITKKECAQIQNEYKTKHYNPHYEQNLSPAQEARPKDRIEIKNKEAVTKTLLEAVLATDALCAYAEGEAKAAPDPTKTFQEIFVGELVEQRQDGFYKKFFFGILGYPLKFLIGKTKSDAAIFSTPTAEDQQPARWGEMHNLFIQYGFYGYYDHYDKALPPPPRFSAYDKSPCKGKTKPEQGRFIDPEHSPLASALLRPKLDPTPGDSRFFDWSKEAPCKGNPPSPHFCMPTTVST